MPLKRKLDEGRPLAAGSDGQETQQPNLQKEWKRLTDYLFELTVHAAGHDGVAHCDAVCFSRKVVVKRFMEHRAIAEGILHCHFLERTSVVGTLRHWFQSLLQQVLQQHESPPIPREARGAFAAAVDADQTGQKKNTRVLTDPADRCEALLSRMPLALLAWGKFKFLSEWSRRLFLGWENAQNIYSFCGEQQSLASLFLDVFTDQCGLQVERDVLPFMRHFLVEALTLHPSQTTRPSGPTGDEHFLALAHQIACSCAECTVFIALSRALRKRRSQTLLNAAASTLASQPAPPDKIPRFHRPTQKSQPGKPREHTSTIIPREWATFSVICDQQQFGVAAAAADSAQQQQRRRRAFWHHHCPKQHHQAVSLLRCYRCTFTPPLLQHRQHPHLCMRRASDFNDDSRCLNLWSPLARSLWNRYSAGVREIVQALCDGESGAVFTQQDEWSTTRGGSAEQMLHFLEHGSCQLRLLKKTFLQVLSPPLFAEAVADVFCASKVFGAKGLLGKFLRCAGRNAPPLRYCVNRHRDDQFSIQDVFRVPCPRPQVTFATNHSSEQSSKWLQQHVLHRKKIFEFIAICKHGSLSTRQQINHLHAECAQIYGTTIKVDMLAHVESLATATVHDSDSSSGSREGGGGCGDSGGGGGGGVGETNNDGEASSIPAWQGAFELARCWQRHIAAQAHWFGDRLPYWTALKHAFHEVWRMG